MRLAHPPSSTFAGTEEVVCAMPFANAIPCGPNSVSLRGRAEYSSRHGVFPLALPGGPGSDDATALDVLQDDGPDASVAPTGTWLVPARAAGDPGLSTGRRRTPGI